MTPQKRLFDLLAAGFGLLLLSPLFAIVAVLIKVGEGGPVFFRQARVGRFGREFRIWKFRTMVVDADRRGRALTAGGDPRVTPIGAVLRRLKIDELPQLLNVLAGDMSLVGPRPEVAVYTAFYTDAERAVLSWTPGITDPASLQYRDESALLGGVADPERLYLSQVMPEKVRISIDYARRATLRSDLGVILETLHLLPASGSTVRAGSLSAE